MICQKILTWNDTRSHPGEARHVKHLIGDIFNSRASQRPSAAEISKRFLDLYNDYGLAARDAELSDLFNKTRKLIHKQRLQRCQDKMEERNIGLWQQNSPQRVREPASDTSLTKAEVRKILQWKDSWDDPGSDLRLAPECMFILGAGILWDIVDIRHIPIESNHVSRDTNSPDGITLPSYLL